MSQQGAAAQRRYRRDPEFNREAILAAAAQVFAERGYQQATLREIARRAGVTHGLVVRHFGTKEQLFLAAVPGTRDLADDAAGPLETLPERLAAGYVRRMETSAGTDPLLALLRSAVVDDNASGRLLEAMQRSTSEVYREILGEEATDAVAPFMASLLIGVTFSRYIARAGALAEMSAATLQAHLTTCLRALLATVVSFEADDQDSPRR
ncbi:TetR family transcriptional regulator [Actinopolymorpha sp. B17G11]|uniref:TetR/AcrR family transcriptional regulator n=1 Tax=Actinopolymorpha sp. B17G11 TaxID=3160861 RepID=UPI0032E40314